MTEKEILCDEEDVEAGIQPPESLEQVQEATEIGLNPETDPFAAREGQSLMWRNVNMTLAAKKNKPELPLLQNVWGQVPKRETMAIMGPSGSGKTSLLNILAGRRVTRGRMIVESEVFLDNVKVDPASIDVRRHIAFVAQDDSLQITSTPREAIRFSAKLRLPRTTSEGQIDSLTERMLVELGLSKCADTIIGGALIAGISGGERKRTSVGVELVVKPAMVFLDEPTSGLDSFNAVQLCQVLKKVANAGASVMFTIHQPASEIFNSFDNLILLNKGRVMYQGSVGAVPEFFEQCGYPSPGNYNPADHLMKIAQSVSVDELEDAGFFPKDKRHIEVTTDANGEGVSKLFGMPFRKRGAAGKLPEGGVGLLTQTWMLLKRELLSIKRDKVATKGRFALTTFLSTISGIIFFDVAEADLSDFTNLQSAFGAVSIILFMSMLGTAMPTLLAFPEQRPVFLREYSTNHYSVVSYFAGRLAIEALVTFVQVLEMTIITYFMIGFNMAYGILFSSMFTLAMSSTALAVMIGCSIEDPKLGTEFLPMVFVPQMLLSGFFVAPGLIPNWLRWIRFLCPLTYALRIVMVAEFGDCEDGKADENCDNLLTATEADEDDTWWYWLVLLTLFAFFRLLALSNLRRKATKFF